MFPKSHGKKQKVEAEADEDQMALTFQTSTYLNYSVVRQSSNKLIKTEFSSNMNR